MIRCRHGGAPHIFLSLPRSIRRYRYDSHQSSRRRFTAANQRHAG
jgi:hypothetical protein